MNKIKFKLYKRIAILIIMGCFCCILKKKKYEVKDLAIDTSVFTIKDGNFKDIYLIGHLIGTGILGEVRKCKSK